MKSELPLNMENASKSLKISFRLVSTILTASLACYGIFHWLNPAQSVNIEKLENLCPQLEKLVPKHHEILDDIDYFHSPEYKNKSLAVWGDSVRIATSNYDDMGEVGEDSRWEIFYNFSSFLFEAFPNVTAASKVSRVNTHGLVYTINGKKKELKPVMLCGHQDVVPVPEETVERWTYPPFAGVFDGDYLWGRGSSDCKNNVIAVFEALEELLSKGFELERTIIIALGFDEETSGHRGAAKISEFLEDKWGKDSIFMIIDEGGLGVQDINGARFALPATGEKGYIDIVVDLFTTGGHSSIPPRHTGIGILADLIHEIEREEFPLDLTPRSPFFYQLQCEAKASKDMDEQLRSDISHMSSDKAAKNRVLEELSLVLDRKALVHTTQAVDIVFGGVKINALPEKVTVKINHRVAYDSSIEETKQKVLDAVNKIADKFQVDVEAFGELMKQFQTSSGLFNVSADTVPIKAAPLTPTIGNPSWDIFGGTIRHVFEDFAKFDEPKEVVVSPSCMTGNTDTRHYWQLTNNIYRFTPVLQNKRLNAHAVDERVQLDAHIDGVAFFYQFLRNLNGYSGN